MKSIMINKPISLFDPGASVKLQGDVESMVREREQEEQDNNFIKQPTSNNINFKPQLNYIGMDDQSPKNLKLKNLINTVNRVKEVTSHRSQVNSKDEGMSEQVAQKLRKAIEVN